MLAFLVSLALAAPCEATLDARPVPQAGGRCLAAAAATAISARGGRIDPRELAPQLPLSRNGEDPYDLQVALQPLGWDTLVFEGSMDQGARLLEAGFAPVMFVADSGTPHAVTIAGVRRRPTPDGRCLGAVEQVGIIDPRKGTLDWTSATDLVRHGDGSRMLVSFETTARSTLDDAGFDLRAATRADRRYRAESLIARAEARREPDAESIALLERAAAADPTWPEPRRLLAIHRQALLDPPP